MKNETKKVAKLSHLLVLCDELDDFEKFNENLKNLLSSSDMEDLLYRIRKYSNGEFCFNLSKIKTFYKENIKIIDKINKLTSLDFFIRYNYDQNGNLSNDFNYFYQYILNNKNSLNNIISLLNELKTLGFNQLEFDEEEDFTKKSYGAYPYFKNNISIDYLDNIEVIPTYDSYIEYKTTNSNYKIRLNISRIESSIYSMDILVNSLLFDPSRLPKKLTKETTFDHILKLKLGQEKTRNFIKNSVDLGVSVFELETQLDITDKTIRNLDNVKNKKLLLDALANIKKEIEKLKSIELENNHSILQEDPDLTSEILNKEKKLRLRRNRFPYEVD